MLISLLFANLTAFSQTDTSTSVKSFPIPIVRLIMKDLLSGDSAKAQLKLVEKEVVELNNKIVLKDSVINTLRLKEDNYMTIINSEKEKYKIVESYSKKLEWDLKKEKTKNKFKSFVGTAIIGVLAFFIIQK